MRLVRPTRNTPKTPAIAEDEREIAGNDLFFASSAGTRPSGFDAAARTWRPMSSPKDLRRRHTTPETEILLDRTAIGLYLREQMTRLKSIIRPPAAKPRHVLPSSGARYPYSPICKQEIDARTRPIMQSKPNSSPPRMKRNPLINNLLQRFRLAMHRTKQTQFPGPITWANRRRVCENILASAHRPQQRRGDACVARSCVGDGAFACRTRAPTGGCPYKNNGPRAFQQGMPRNVHTHSTPRPPAGLCRLVAYCARMARRRPQAPRTRDRENDPGFRADAEGR